MGRRRSLIQGSSTRLVQAEEESSDYGPTDGTPTIRAGVGPNTVSDPGVTSDFEFATLADLATKINAKPANSIFVATATSYTPSSQLTWTAGLHPKIYFPGPAGTRTIDGGGAGINGVSVPAGGCEIYGGTFTGFGTTANAGIVCRGEMTLESVIATNCYQGIGGGGIAADGRNQRVTVRHCGLNDNLLAGAVLSHADGLPVTFEYNEVSGNNTGDFNPGGTASGCKFLHNQSSSVYRYNWAHGNYTWGLWWDSSEGPHEISDNVCENNGRAGLFFERSGDAVIHHNYATGNGNGGTIGGQAQTASNGWQTLIRNSDTVEVYAMDVDMATGVERTLAMAQQSDEFATNYNFHDNRIWLRTSSARVGGYDDNTVETLVTEPTLDWTDNLYKVASTATSYWQWAAGEGVITWAAWEALAATSGETRELI